MNILARTTAAAIFAVAPQLSNAQEIEISDYAHGIANDITEACKNPQDLASCLKGTMQITLDFSREYSQRYNENPSLQGFVAGIQRGIADGTLIAHCDGKLKGDFSYNSLKEAHQYTVDAVTDCLNATRTVAGDLGKNYPGFVEEFDDQAWSVLRNHLLCLNKDDRCQTSSTGIPEFKPAQ
jgi:hypothetical protein